MTKKIHVFRNGKLCTMQVVNGNRDEYSAQWEKMMAKWEKEKAEPEQLEAEWAKCESLLRKMPRNQWPKLPFSIEELKELRTGWEIKKEKMEAMQRYWANRTKARGQLILIK